jgi:hypothetical protein
MVGECDGRRDAVLPADRWALDLLSRAVHGSAFRAGDAIPLHELPLHHGEDRDDRQRGEIAA